MLIISAKMRTSAKIDTRRSGLSKFIVAPPCALAPCSPDPSDPSDPSVPSVPLDPHHLCQALVLDRLRRGPSGEVADPDEDRDQDPVGEQRGPPLREEGCGQSGERDEAGDPADDDENLEGP